MAQGRALMALLLALLAAWPIANSLPAASGGSFACGTLVASGCQSWTAIYSDGEILFPEVVASPDGERVFTVAHDFPMEGIRYGRLAINAYHAATGALLWNLTYGLSNGYRMALVSPSGDHLYIVGEEGVGSTSQAYLLTLDPFTGDILWTATLALESRGIAVTTSPDGSRVYLAGVLRNNFVTAALNAQNGQTIWQSTYDNHGGKDAQWGYWSFDSAFDVAASPDGTSLAVTGMSAAPSGLREYATVAYDATTGAQRWVTRANATDLTGALVQSGGFNVAFSPDSQRVYALGTDGLKAYDVQTGNDLWNRRTEGAACRLWWSLSHKGECNLEVSPSGDRLYVGTHNNVASYDSMTGELVWRLPIHVGDDDKTVSVSLGNDMVLHPDGTRLYLVSKGGKDYYVTDRDPTLNSVFETVALDTADGSLRWRVTYDRGSDQVYGIDVSPDGSRVYVAGDSEIQRPADMVTLAYETAMGLDAPSPLSV